MGSARAGFLPFYRMIEERALHSDEGAKDVYKTVLPRDTTVLTLAA